ncbi:unnamed protein product [Amoebophrya sp. A120]|nr:unnamed protein product [Amoebophrya sp. A120]|eukprot:GSA120T00025453001.1
MKASASHQSANSSSASAMSANKAAKARAKEGLLKQLVADSMDLCQPGRVTSKNAFALSLLERLSEALRASNYLKGDSFELHEGAYLLEAATKLYGHRVDSVSSLVVRVMHAMVDIQVASEEEELLRRNGDHQEGGVARPGDVIDRTGGTLMTLDELEKQSKGERVEFLRDFLDNQVYEKHLLLNVKPDCEGKLLLQGEDPVAPHDDASSSKEGKLLLQGEDPVAPQHDASSSKAYCEGKLLLQGEDPVAPPQHDASSSKAGNDQVTTTPGSSSTLRSGEISSGGGRSAAEPSSRPLLPVVVPFFQQSMSRDTTNVFGRHAAGPQQGTKNKRTLDILPAAMQYRQKVAQQVLLSGGSKNYNYGANKLVSPLAELALKYDDADDEAVSPSTANTCGVNTTEARIRALAEKLFGHKSSSGASIMHSGAAATSSSRGARNIAANLDDDRKEGFVEAPGFVNLRRAMEARVTAKGAGVANFKTVELQQPQQEADQVEPPPKYVYFGETAPRFGETPPRPTKTFYGPTGVFRKTFDEAEVLTEHRTKRKMFFSDADMDQYEARWKLEVSSSASRGQNHHHHLGGVRSAAATLFDDGSKKGVGAPSFFIEDDMINNNSPLFSDDFSRIGATPPEAEEGSFIAEEGRNGAALADNISLTLTGALPGGMEGSSLFADKNFGSGADGSASLAGDVVMMDVDVVSSGAASLGRAAGDGNNYIQVGVSEESKIQLPCSSSPTPASSKSKGTASAVFQDYGLGATPFDADFEGSEAAASSMLFPTTTAAARVLQTPSVFDHTAGTNNLLHENIFTGATPSENYTGAAAVFDPETAAQLSCVPHGKYALDSTRAPFSAEADDVDAENYDVDMAPFPAGGVDESDPFDLHPVLDLGKNNREEVQVELPLDHEQKNLRTTHGLSLGGPATPATKIEISPLETRRLEEELLEQSPSPQSKRQRQEGGGAVVVERTEQTFSQQMEELEEKSSKHLTAANPNVNQASEEQLALVDAAGAADELSNRLSSCTFNVVSQEVLASSNGQVTETAVVTKITEDNSHTTSAQLVTAPSGSSSSSSSEDEVRKVDRGNKKLDQLQERDVAPRSEDLFQDEFLFGDDVGDDDVQNFEAVADDNEPGRSSQQLPFLQSNIQADAATGQLVELVSTPVADSTTSAKKVKPLKMKMRKMAAKRNKAGKKQSVKLLDDDDDEEYADGAEDLGQNKSAAGNIKQDQVAVTQELLTGVYTSLLDTLLPNESSPENSPTEDGDKKEKKAGGGRDVESVVGDSADPFATFDDNFLEDINGPAGAGEDDFLQEDHDLMDDCSHLLPEQGAPEGDEDDVHHLDVDGLLGEEAFLKKMNQDDDMKKYNNNSRLKEQTTPAPRPGIHDDVEDYVHFNNAAELEEEEEEDLLEDAGNAFEENAFTNEQVRDLVAKAMDDLFAEKRSVAPDFLPGRPPGIVKS